MASFNLIGIKNAELQSIESGSGRITLAGSTILAVQSAGRIFASRAHPLSFAAPRLFVPLRP
jgi:hypothetical protein